MRVEVEVASTGEILRRLLDGRLQLALVGSNDADERVAFEPFLDDELVGIAKPGLVRARNGRVRAEDLSGQMLLAREPESASRKLADRALAAAGVRPAGVWELGSSEAIKRTAREGLGFAFVSRYAVAEEVDRGELAAFRLADAPRIERRFWSARLSGRPLSPAESGFLRTLRTCCKKSEEYAAACLA